MVGYMVASTGDRQPCCRLLLGTVLNALTSSSSIVDCFIKAIGELSTLDMLLSTPSLLSFDCSSTISPIPNVLTLLLHLSPPGTKSFVIASLTSVLHSSETFFCFRLLPPFLLGILSPRSQRPSLPFYHPMLRRVA